MKFSNFDADQIQRLAFSDDEQAFRMTLVGMDNLVIEPKIDLEPLKEALMGKPSEAPAQAPTVEIKVVEVPKIVVQPEVKVVEIERPVLIEKVNIERVEVPVVVKEVEIKEVEKLIYLYKPVEVTRVKEHSLVTVFQAFQALALLGMFIKLMLMK